MKTIVTATLLLVALSTGTFASPKGKRASISTREISTASFQKLLVDKNIRVVLVADANRTAVTIAGDQDYLQTISVSTENGAMHIAATKNFKSNKVTVYIPVKNLLYLELKANAFAISEGTLACANLSVLLNAGSTVQLKNIGSIDVRSSEDAECIYEKNEVTKVEETK